MLQDENGKVAQSVVVDVQTREGEFTPDDLAVISQAAQNGIYDDTVDDTVNETIVTSEEAVTDVAPSTIEEAEELERIKRASEQMLEQAQREREEAEQVLKDEIAALKEGQSKPIEKEIERLDPVSALDSLKREDYSTEYDFIKARLDMSERLIRTQSVQDPRLDSLMPEIEVIKQQRQTDEAKAKAAENAKFFKTQLESFWEKVPTMKPSKPYESAEREYGEFREAVTEKLGLNETETDRTLAQLNTAETRESIKALVEARGITIPDDFFNIYQTLVAYDYQQGRKTDPITGVSQDIVGPDNKRVYQRSMEDAYYLLDRNNYEIMQRRESALQMQQQIEKVSGGASTIPTDRLDTVALDDAFTSERAANIFKQVRADPHSWSTDPDKIRLKQQAMAFAQR